MTTASDVMVLAMPAPAEVTSLNTEPTTPVPGILIGSRGLRSLLAATRLAVERSKRQEELEIFIFVSGVSVLDIFECEIMGIYTIEFQI
jgi:hypothetical protein